VKEKPLLFCVYYGFGFGLCGNDARDVEEGKGFGRI